jgi:FtsH-binding integral membrane protein
MHQVLKDTAGLGLFFWLLGYLAGIVLFFTPFAGSMGWIILVLFTPFTILVTWWWFRPRERLSLRYYAGVGIFWMLIAVVLDYLFIVLLFRATAYYSLHIFLYYALMFLIPAGVGLYLNRRTPLTGSG